MESLLIKATNSTPEINFNFESGNLLIKGDSYPENAFAFYKPVMKWIEEFIAINQKRINLNVQLIYFNSSTSKTLYDLFDILNEIKKDDIDVIINWIYDEKNYSAFEFGEEFKEDYELLTFNLVPNLN